MKKNIAEPEMKVIRFNAQEIVTATSGSIPIGPPLGCGNPPGEGMMV